jgi:hypothetical protein
MLSNIPESVLKQLWKISPASLAVHLTKNNRIPWVAAPHLSLLSGKITDLVAGRCPRLIVTMPPRHGKSEMVSHWTPVWLLENWPHKRVILASYEADFAASWGRKVRDSINAYQDELTLRLDPNTQAVSTWLTIGGGGMSTAGVGGPITGKGADLLVIDDALKNSQEANSYTIREKLWEWYQSTARTRLEPGGGMIVMFTRWHEDDLVGRLIHQMSQGGEHWEVFNFPAIAEDHDLLGRKPGQALWPARYDEKALMALKSSMSPKVWNALYQQSPSGDDDIGNVYHTFSTANVAKGEISFDPRLPLVWTLDFNVDPMTSVIAQYIPGITLQNSLVNVLDEIYLPNSNTYKMVHEFAGRVSRLTGGRQIVVEIFGDASGKQRKSSGDKTDWEIIKANLALYPFIIPQYRYKSKNPGVKERVNATVTMLCAADGTRRMLIDPKCVELIADFRKISWDIDNDGNPTGQMNKSDMKRTHVSDALGYFMESKFGLKTQAGGRPGFMQ